MTIMGIVDKVVGDLDDVFNVQCASTPRLTSAALLDGKTVLVPRANAANVAAVLERGFAGTKQNEPEWTVHYLFGPAVKLSLIHI